MTVIIVQYKDGTSDSVVVKFASAAVLQDDLNVMKPGDFVDISGILARPEDIKSIVFHEVKDEEVQACTDLEKTQP